MKANFKLNVNLLNSVVITQNVNIDWENIEDRKNFSSWFQDEDVIGLRLTPSSKQFFAEYSSGGGQVKTSNFDTLSTNENWISFIAETDSNIGDIDYLLSLGVIEILPIQNQTLFFAYTQNSENDALSKNLSLVTIIYGKFNQVIGLKNIDIDIHGYERNYNYIYIPIFNRYYYVDSIDFISANFTRLHLKEDVLMSWKDLIKQQDAFVTRYENSTENGIVDVRFPLEDKMNVSYKTPTPTAQANSKVNTTLNLYLAEDEFKFLVSSISASERGNTIPLSSPDTNLPACTILTSKNERVQFISTQQLGDLVDAVRSESAIASFINSVILLPFNPYYTYNGYNTGQQTDAWISGAPVQANDKYLCTDGRFHTMQEVQDSGYVLVQGAQSYLAGSPYFIIADFTMPKNIDDTADDSTYLDYEPYTYVEIYVPFVGWVKLNFSQVAGKRLIVFYTLDYKTGMGTAYIHNITNHELIYSSNCQFGIKIDLTTTNAEEITRQKQANELNMILGLMASAVSIGVGVVTENPVAVVGGVLSAGKTIASNVNSNRMLFERAQTSFGTSEGIFHSPMSVHLRYTYHEPVAGYSLTYGHMQGYPYNKYVALSSLTSGYVEIGEIHFNPLNEVIYQDEINEIVSLLQNGVIF